MLQLLTRRSPPLHTTRLHNQTFRRMASRASFNNYLITPSQLCSALNSDKNALIPVSAAWFMPNDPQKRTGLSSFLASHIPNSRFFDIDAVSDRSSPYPHMLPSASDFAAHVGKLGISADDTLVVYDAPESGLFSAPRVAWTFRVFGHKGEVHVLNSFKAWKAEGRQSVSSPGLEKYPPKKYEAIGPDPAMVTDFAAVKDLALNHQGEVVILDARSQGRWSGADPEPRQGLSSGHIPGSQSLPFTALLDPETKNLKSAGQLCKLFSELGVKGDKPIVTSCGSGVTASVIEAALIEAGVSNGKTKVYDGSWSEWAQRATEAEGLIVKSA